MVQRYICSEGHRWRAMDEGKPQSAAAAPVCPVCRAPGAPYVPAESPAQAAGKDLFASSTPTLPTADEARPGLDFLAPATSQNELGWLGSYRVLKILGRGGMGMVFQAEDILLKRMVALKVMLPALATSDTAQQRFLREARATAALKHDNIVTIYQVGQERDVPFLAMEFLDGESLQAYLERHGKPALEEVLCIGRETAQGLAAAHARGLVHRDIKPANIWLEVRSQESGVRGRVSRDAESSERSAGSSFRDAESSERSAGIPFRVKILDFGLARDATVDTHLTQTGVVMGTPSFMSPEQARGEVADARSDLFSLGCLLYVMCTAELPFKGSNTTAMLVAITVDTPRPPRELNADVPPALSDLIVKLLAKEPDGRPSSASAVADTLARIKPMPAEVWSGSDKPTEFPSKASVAPAGKPAERGKRAALEQKTEEVSRPPARSGSVARLKAKQKKQEKKQQSRYLLVGLCLLLPLLGAIATYACLRPGTPPGERDTAQGSTPSRQDPIKQPPAVEPQPPPVVPPKVVPPKVVPAVDQAAKEKEQQLIQAVNENTFTPNSSEEERKKAFSARIALGAYYLKNKRFNDAEKHFENLRKYPAFHPFSVLGETGLAVTRAFQDRAEESNQLIIKVKNSPQKSPGGRLLSEILNFQDFHPLLIEALDKNEKKAGPLPKDLEELRESLK